LNSYSPIDLAGGELVLDELRPQAHLGRAVDRAPVGRIGRVEAQIDGRQAIAAEVVAVALAVGPVEGDDRRDRLGEGRVRVTGQGADLEGSVNRGRPTAVNCLNSVFSSS
jgi:hypothetical protein